MPRAAGLTKTSFSKYDIEPGMLKRKREGGGVGWWYNRMVIMIK